MPSAEVAKHNGFKCAINNGDADIVVYAKPTPTDLESAKVAKAEGAKIVVDFAGDHFESDPTYTEFALLADIITSPTPAIRARIYDYTKRDSVVIPDPYEQAEMEPHADGDNYLWFGHNLSMKELIPVLGSMSGRKLRVVSGPKVAPTTIPWSLENMKEAFAVSNIVILPTTHGSEHKSPNRLLNSIRAGCFPVCMTHPAYLEFRNMVWVGHFPTGLKWAEAFRVDLNALVKEAQEYIRDRYSPEAVGKQWASVLA
jgi:hypothetical protein